MQKWGEVVEEGKPKESVRVRYMVGRMIEMQDAINYLERGEK